MLILILAVLVLAMVAGSVFVAARSLPTPTHPSLGTSEHAALERRLRALEESLERTDARLARVEEAQEFTTRLLSERPGAPDALPPGDPAVRGRTSRSSAADDLRSG